MANLSSSHHTEPFDEAQAPEPGHCERCQRHRPCELVPMHGYSLLLCNACAAAAYRAGDPV